ncbi:uncharacterized protein LOC101852617 [Aplysia californica]|uniref:Uncharacterized protein LOC101852617 n=1 Tax=Aplysia californica TaxID=6500 RepID=A0ABM0JKU0_APLCA|nr:uncharacterized protein LOC101852617 [Aplysia californica]XP_005096065.1 uncharacterized protein LOC101852617 [Aplysia californica]XP_005096066.1 uncharacterized protein LOC101852617 [Aplysia californica]XP_005096067.1 uncharacterized protein LOC101852617 [Aplysia californica]XP_005096068.1 uncharacterized protein LOC101852617 [Aplysia californica]XP_005096069.1 uncharacterized protein LOC101852617 [Aplysia californica]
MSTCASIHTPHCKLDPSIEQSEVEMKGANRPCKSILKASSISFPEENGCDYSDCSGVGDLSNGDSIEDECRREGDSSTVVSMLEAKRDQPMTWCLSEFDNSYEPSLAPKEEPQTYTSVIDGCGDILCQFQLQRSQVSEQSGGLNDGVGCADEKPDCGGIVSRVGSKSYIPVSSGVDELEERRGSSSFCDGEKVVKLYLCDENSNASCPLVEVRKTKVSFAEPTILEVCYEEGVPPSYKSTLAHEVTLEQRLKMLPKALVVLPFTLVRKKLSRKQIMQLGAMMALGFVLVGGILVWVFSPAIFG